MRRPPELRNNWDESSIAFLKSNAHRGYTFLAAHFNYSDGGIRQVAKKHHIQVTSAKNIRDQDKIQAKKNLPRENAAFILQEVLPNGSSKVWIPAEKISLIVPADKDVQSVVDKIVFRHTALKFE